MTTIQVSVTMTQTLNNGDSIVSVDTIESNNQVSPEADADEHTSHEWLRQYISGRFNEVITLRTLDAAYRASGTPYFGHEDDAQGLSGALQRVYYAARSAGKL